MRGAWRSHAAAERQVPVEMRFIDMFMAALGSLIFMAMLLAFLLKYLPDKPGPGDDDFPPPPPPPPALRIATRSLPPGRVGEPYEVAIAYRGGSGPVSWKVVDGDAKVPRGLRLDRQAGILSGTPSKDGKARFILQVSDLRGGEHRQRLELSIEPQKGLGRKFGTVTAAVMLGLLFLILLAAFGGIAAFQERLAMCQQAWARGQTEIVIQTGLHEEERIELPEGIEIYEKRRLAAIRFSALMVVIFLLALVWFIRRTWGA